MVKKIYKPAFRGDSCLTAIDLACERGHNELFTELSFLVSEGEILHVAGANGVGKSTLLRILANLYQPDAGIITWNSRDINEISAVYRSDVAYLGHKSGLRGDMTPLENLDFYASLTGSVSGCEPENCLEQFRVVEYGNIPCCQLSTGQRQRVAIARLCLDQKRLWLLDEPATALDPEGIQILENLIEIHVDGGGMVIFCSHQSLGFESGKRLTVTLAPETRQDP